MIARRRYLLRIKTLPPDLLVIDLNRQESEIGIVDGTQDAMMASRETLMAAGGLLGALAASSCCIFPLVLFGLGVSGAWIGNFTRLAPYHPFFITATLAFLGYGYWLVYRSSTRGCTDGEACARPLPHRIVKASLFLATILVVAALGLDFIAPLFLNS